MGKEKYIYNTHTLRYERVANSLKTKLLQFFGLFSGVVVTGFVFMLVLHRYFPSPTEKTLIRENRQLQAELGENVKEIERLGEVLGNIQQRDAYAHRMIFGMDPIDEGVWNGGTGGHDKYKEYRQFRNSGSMLISVKEKMDKLKHQLDLQSRSLDTIVTMAKEKEKLLASMPSIKPVRADKLARDVKLLSGFGYRIHPIFKVPRMHAGLDFTAPQGTPIQATGAGRVIKAERGNGYGNHVVIDHGYGYQTLYGHMSKIDVKEGQMVRRGQVIGKVGSTGTSTAPHCHYEVHYRGQAVNPIQYVIDGLTPKEYAELVKAAESANQSFD